MLKPKNNTLKTLRITAVLEGISYLLFAVTMPLKYMAGIKEPNLIVGMAHGILFIIYNLLVLKVAFKYKWNFKRTIICLIASILPFATFWVDKRILKPISEETYQ